MGCVIWPDQVKTINYFVRGKGRIAVVTNTDMPLRYAAAMLGRDTDIRHTLLVSAFEFFLGKCSLRLTHIQMISEAFSHLNFGHLHVDKRKGMTLMPNSLHANYFPISD